MPYEVRQLLDRLDRVVSVAPEKPLGHALELMLKHDYSQLPVIDEIGGKQKHFLVTSDSILLALNSYGASTAAAGLHVSDAMVKVPKVYKADNDLFELLQGMRETGAAIVVDDQGNLQHIVTSYDTTVYFRQWAEDMMRARDIEASLKTFVNEAFKTTDDRIDEAARQTAIDDITPSNKSLRKKFNEAINGYLRARAKARSVADKVWLGEALLLLIDGSETGLATDVHAGCEIAPDTASNTEFMNEAKFRTGDVDYVTAASELRARLEAALVHYLTCVARAEVHSITELVDDAFERLLDPRDKKTEFKELALDGLMTLFFHDRCWSRCASAVNLTKEQVKFMLDGVRGTRNKLAHFREDEITAAHRAQLNSCAEWLGNNSKSIIATLRATQESSIGVSLHHRTAEPVGARKAPENAALISSSHVVTLEQPTAVMSVLPNDSGEV